MDSVETVIKISSLSKEVDGVKLFDALSLEILRGEFVCLMGRSGCGKTTLLNIIAGIDTDYRGAATVMGADIQSLDDNARTNFRNRNIGFIFQSYNLLERLTCLDNVLVPSLFGRNKKDYKEKAFARLKQFGIEDKADKKPLKLSGGERQRVAICRALLLDPAIILADEPTGNLDEKTADETIDKLAGLVKSEQKTLVMVTHESRIAKGRDRALQLENGVIREIKNC